MELVLSLFPGIDLFGRAFRTEGFCVVAGPDKLLGDDVRTFHGFPNRFDGIIGGPPCQDWSCANTHRRRKQLPPTNGLAMLGEFVRIVGECAPEWFLMENVPNVPDVSPPGYSVQRFDLTDLECGGRQRRLRHFQFGHRDGWIIRPQRGHTSRATRFAPCVDTKASDRAFAELCRLQGLGGPLQLIGWNRTGKRTAVGNGVPITMGRILAQAVAKRSPPAADDCLCGCGRRVTGKQLQATAACRKRMERKRRSPRLTVTGTAAESQELSHSGRVTAGPSQQPGPLELGHSCNPTVSQRSRSHTSKRPPAGHDVESHFVAAREPGGVTPAESHPPGASHSAAVGTAAPQSDAFPTSGEPAALHRGG